MERLNLMAAIEVKPITASLVEEKYIYIYATVNQIPM